MPAALLHGVAGDLADELLLGGQRVLPDKALLSGFAFRHSTLRHALSAMLGANGRHPAHRIRRRRYFGGGRGASVPPNMELLVARHRLSDKRFLR